MDSPRWKLANTNCGDIFGCGRETKGRPYMFKKPFCYSLVVKHQVSQTSGILMCQVSTEGVVKALLHLASVMWPEVSWKSYSTRVFSCCITAPQNDFKIKAISHCKFCTIGPNGGYPLDIIIVDTVTEFLIKLFIKAIKLNGGTQQSLFSCLSGCLRDSPPPLMMHSPPMPQFHAMGQQSPPQTKKHVRDPALTLYFVLSRLQQNASLHYIFKHVCWDSLEA